MSDSPIAVDKTESGAHDQVTQIEPILQPLSEGNILKAAIDRAGHHDQTAASPSLLLPGSFNPVHDGHWQLHTIAEALTGKSAAFELSIVNVDKPPLTPEVIQARLRQFHGRSAVWLTRAPTFLEKARLFPGAVFVVGADTAARIVAARYYADSEAMHAALSSIEALGCRFLVGGRIDDRRQFVTANCIDVPDPFRHLFESIPEAAFRADISSTDLRKRLSS